MVTAIGALGILTPSAEAGITWVSQNRYGGYGTYQEPTAYGRSIGDVPGYSVYIDKKYVATDFGPFTVPLGYPGMTSDIDTAANVITAKGGGDTNPTPTQTGIQYTFYSYVAVHFEATFRLTEATPYTVTNRSFIASDTSNLTLVDPGGQTLAFPTVPNTYQGVLDAGDWTVLATGAPGGPDAGTRFDFTVALPEPSTAAAAAAASAAGLLLAGRRRTRRP
jgi:hypothetical protein